MNETARLEALKKFEILDTPPDGSFDDIVRLVTEILDVPIGLVSLVDEDRIWFKSKVGLETVQIGRDPGLCATAILSNDFYQIENAPTDLRALANPLVAGEFGLKFYAASPLTTKDGFNLGTLCVMDVKPRKLSESESKVLARFAKLVMNQMELRLQSRQAVSVQNKLAQFVAHNLKGFIGTLPAFAKIIKEDKAGIKKNDEPLEMLVKESEKHYTQIVSFLEQSSQLVPRLDYDLQLHDFNEVVSSVVKTNRILAQRKNQSIDYIRYRSPIPLKMDRDRMIEAVDNLINNAIKFSHQGTRIVVKCYEENGLAIFSVTDEGLGLMEADLPLLFKRFTKLSAQPTGNELSSGIGLWMTKDVIDAHGGKIEAISKGINEGTTFRVEFELCH